MMRDTPRTFVGPVVLLLEEILSDDDAARVSAEVEQLEGIRSCLVDAAGRTVIVTAQNPVDRNTVVATLHRHGCRFRA